MVVLLPRKPRSPGLSLRDHYLLEGLLSQGTVVACIRIYVRELLKWERAAPEELVFDM